MDIKDKSIRVCRMFQYVVGELIDGDWLLPSAAPVIVDMGLTQFSSLFPSGVSDGRIVDFVVYQLYRFRDMVGVKGSRWNFSWCFSQNAVFKFKAQFLDKNGKSGMMYYIDKWLDEADLSREKLENMIRETNEHHLAKLVYIQSEDSVKARFPDLDMRLQICLSSTTGWTPKSQVCKSCGNSTRCISLSKKKYPELIRLRMKDNGK